MAVFPKRYFSEWVQVSQVEKICGRGLTSNATIASDKHVKFIAEDKVKLEAGFNFSSDGTGTFKAMRANCLD